MTLIREWPREWWPQNASRFHLQAANLSAASMLTGRRSVFGPLMERWICEFTSAPQKRREWLGMAAFFSGTGGTAALIRMGDPKRAVPGLNLPPSRTSEPWSDSTYFSDGKGWATSTIPPYAHIAEGADAEDDSLVIGGLPASTNPCLFAGDLFEIRPGGIAATHGHLYEVFQDAPTDALGRTRVTINPPLRANVLTGDQIVLRYPTTVFRAVDDSQGQIEHGRVRSSIAFTLIEELP